MLGDTDPVIFDPINGNLTVKVKNGSGHANPAEVIVWFKVLEGAQSTVGGVSGTTGNRTQETIAANGIGAGATVSKTAQVVFASDEKTVRVEYGVTYNGSDVTLGEIDCKKPNVFTKTFETVKSFLGV